MYSDYLLVRKIKQGDDNAADLTQETFVRFFTKLSDYHHKGKCLNYLYTIAGNLCRDCVKKTKEMPLEENSLIEDEVLQDRQMERVFNHIFMEQVLNQLSDELREILILYYFQGLKLTEISETLQIGLPLVKYRFRMAKKELEELLGKEEKLLNDNIYKMITMPIWFSLLRFALLFLSITIYRILKKCNKYLEVSLNEIRA